MPDNLRRPTLVTGAAGFIAHHVIERLLRAGTPVMGLDNFDPFYDRELKRRNVADLERVAAFTRTPFVFVEGELGDFSRVWDKGDFGTVFHFAAKAGVRPSLQDPIGYARANVDGTVAVLELCRQRGIPDLVFASSSSVYGDDSPVPFREDTPAARPISPYAASKRAAELYCSTYAHLYGLRVASLRLFTVYGPRQRPDLAIHSFADKIHRGQPITLFGDGTTSRDYTYVTDIVDGVEAAWRWLGKQSAGTCRVFNLGDSAVTPLKKLVEMIEAGLGAKARIEWAPAQPGDVRHTCADISRARDTFGYSPKVKIAEGIPLFLQWFRESRLPARAA